jgi:murein L,D-transpeptidase YafK
MKIFILFLTFMMPLQQSFKETQLQHQRVKDAYREKEITVKNYFVNKNLNYPGFNCFIRAFKKERILEVWVKEKNKDKFALLTTFPFCSSSGEPGPKRKEGDLQIPEGVYYINHFNPKSNFHLSLGINYPNASDRILSDQQSPGSAIYIHGNCVTIGCIPITDDLIKELYVLAVEARNNGQEKIPVHIFPSKLDDAGLKALESRNSMHKSFWKNLQPVYRHFENNKTIPDVKVRKNGDYYLPASNLSS